MKKITLIYLCIAFFTVGCTTIDHTKTKDSYVFEITNYGTYYRNVDKTVSAESSLTGKAAVISKVTWLKQTDKFELEKGKSFGIEYKVTAPEGMENFPVDMLVIRTLPQKVTYRSGSKSYHIYKQIERTPGLPYTTGYTLTSDEDMIPGTWKFMVIYRGDVVLQKEFELTEKETEETKETVAKTETKENEEKEAGSDTEKKEEADTQD